LSWSSPEQANQLHSQSLALYQELDDEVMQAKEMINLSFLAWVGGDFDSALSLIRQSLASSRKMGVQSFIESGLDMLAKIHREKGQLEEAEQCHLQALEISREFGFRIAEGICLENLAHTLICAGRFAEAEVHAQESVRLQEMIGSMNEYSIYLWSQANSHQGMYTQAKGLATRSLDEALRLNGDLTICLALKQLGEIDLVEGRPSEALERLQASLESARAHKQFILSSTPLADLVYTYRALGEPDQARRCLGECLTNVNRTGSFRLAIHALPALALLEADRGNSERAIELHTLAWQYPYIANSKWFEDIAGREIACLAVSLPAERIAAAQAHGRELDFWGAIEEGVRTF
jgi:tetratricopeptide (TPR) repeat protein